MTGLKLLLLPIALLAAPFAAHADDRDDERRYDRAPREVFWEGNCRIEQRANRYGELVERRRCRPDRYTEARRYDSDDESDRAAAYRDAPRDAEPRMQSRDEVPVYRPPLAVTTRVVARAAPVPRTPRLAPKPVPMAPRIVAKAPVPAKTPHLAAHPTPPAKAARTVAPREVAPAAPATVAEADAAAQAPHEAAAPVVKTSGTYPKSDWLVILSPDQAKAEAVVHAPLTPAKAAAPVKSAEAARLGEYEDYVTKKSKERYSNLK